MPSARVLLQNRFTPALSAALLAWALLGCGSTGEHPPGTDWSARQGAGRSECLDGTSEPCSLVIEQASGVTSCFQGERHCEDGAWTSCEERPQPKLADLKQARTTLIGAARSPTAATPCADNECDPSCMVFQEDPPDISGGAPPPTPEFTARPPSQACSHDLCSTGSALPDSGCDPDGCVYTLCDPANFGGAFTYCCSGTWDQNCVNAVYSQCLSQSPPLDICDYGLFSESNSVFPGGTFTGAPMGGHGTLNVGQSGAAVVDSVINDGEVHIHSTSSVLTSTTHTDMLTVHSGGDAGIDIPAASVNMPAQVPELTFPCVSSSGDREHNGGVSIIAPNDPHTEKINAGIVILDGPGDYGKFEFNGTATLIVRGPGIYRFDEFDVKSGDTQVLFPPGERVDMQSCGNFGFDNGSDVGTYVESSPGNYAVGPLAPRPEDIVWYTWRDFKVGPNTSVTGIFIVPNGEFKFENANHTNIHGLAWARTIGGNGTDITFNASIAGDACETLNIFGPTPPTSCPIDNELPGVSAAVTEPCINGNDCQLNQRCEQPLTEDLGGSCSHSKCQPGAPLTGCLDECVQDICAADPSCCSTSWTDSCVSQVSSVCDATCGPATCTEDLCRVRSRPLSASCDPCIASVCSEIPSCCSDSWDQPCVDRVHQLCGPALPAGFPGVTDRACAYSIYGVSGVTMGDHAAQQGTAAVGSNTTVGLAPTATTEGPVFSGIAPQLPDLSALTCPGAGSASIGAASTWHQPPGNYGSVQLWLGGRIQFDAGTYTFTELLLDESNEIILPATGGVTIYVCGRVEIGPGTTFTNINSTSDTLKFRVHSTDTSLGLGSSAAIEVSDSAGTTVYGAYHAPYGSVWIGERATVEGLVWGQEVALGQNATVNSTHAAGAPCENTLLDPGPACPVTPTPGPPDESALCVENESGFSDASCSGVDLALGVPCDDQLPVCNHGTVDFAAAVEVGFYAESEGQMATEIASVVPTGTCSETLTVPAGACETMTCSVPSGIHALLVDPGQNLTECSRRDNWTVHDGRLCGAGVGDTTEVWTYEAVCPPNSAPRWGVLTWDSSTPGTSRIEFSARTAQTETGLSSQSFVPLAVAEQSPNDTQLCTLAGPTPCPVDIYGELDLTPNSGPFLELQAELIAGPILRDWSLTYSCVIDQ